MLLVIETSTPTSWQGSTYLPTQQEQHQQQQRQQKQQRRDTHTRIAPSAGLQEICTHNGKKGILAALNSPAHCIEPGRHLATDLTLPPPKASMARPPTWKGTPSIRGGSEPVRMALLTFSLVGLQFTWGIEMTYCTPYLLSLGLSKSKTSLVWIAGPLSGLVMQPVVGLVADRWRGRWGRRRPFMLAGSLVVAAGLLVLGWTSEIVGWFLGRKEDDEMVRTSSRSSSSSSGMRDGGIGTRFCMGKIGADMFAGGQRKSATVALAVLSIYGVDFAINAGKQAPDQRIRRGFSRSLNFLFFKQSNRRAAL